MHFLRTLSGQAAPVGDSRLPREERATDGCGVGAAVDITKVVEQAAGGEPKSHSDVEVAGVAPDQNCPWRLFHLSEVRKAILGWECNFSGIGGTPIPPAPLIEASG